MLDVFQRAALLIQILDQGAHRRAALPVIALDKGLDLIARADGQSHRHLARIGDGLKRVQRAGVGAEHLQALIAPAYRYDLIVAHEAFGQRRQRVQQRWYSIGEQQGCLQQGRPCAGQFEFGNQSQTRQQPEQLSAFRLLLQALRALQIGRFQTGIFDQPGTNLLGIRNEQTGNFDGS